MKSLSDFVLAASSLARVVKNRSDLYPGEVSQDEYDLANRLCDLELSAISQLQEVLITNHFFRGDDGRDGDTNKTRCGPFVNGREAATTDNDVLGRNVPTPHGLSSTGEDC